mmetsp:Transcript_44416/g.72486  ORF Transcript_44416/g.72486 Transcript_44416/m.72486 type:complete len:106 (+) Transcript_44416:424-741(+)
MYTITDRGPRDSNSLFLCKEAKEKNYILTCSTYPTGSGLVIELDKCHEAWQIQYHDRLQSEEAKEARRAARAQAMKEHALKNPAEWYQDLERVYVEGPSANNYDD